MSVLARSKLRVRVSLAQRRALLERLRRDVATAIEDLTAAAASLRAIESGRSTDQPLTPDERAALQLIRAEQRRLRQELRRVWEEFAQLRLDYHGAPAPALLGAA